MIELYDRMKDPIEMQNLSGDDQYKELIGQLNQQLSERVKRTLKPPKGLKVIK